MSSDQSRARTIGLISACLGVAAGVAEIVTGTNAWTGDKNDPTTLGIVTVVLAMIIGVAAQGLPAASIGRTVAAADGTGISALVELTTAGIAWTPGALTGLAAAALALRAARRWAPWPTCSHDTGPRSC